MAGRLKLSTPVQTFVNGLLNPSSQHKKQSFGCTAHLPNPQENGLPVEQTASEVDTAIACKALPYQSYQ